MTLMTGFTVTGCNISGATSPYPAFTAGFSATMAGFRARTAQACDTYSGFTVTAMGMLVSNGMVNWVDADFRYKRDSRGTYLCTHSNPSLSPTVTHTPSYTSTGSPFPTSTPTFSPTAPTPTQTPTYTATVLPNQLQLVSGDHRTGHTDGMAQQTDSNLRCSVLHPQAVQEDGLRCLLAPTGTLTPAARQT